MPSTPRSLITMLRTARTVALWSFGPIDWTVRAVTGRRHLPPLWLRRHIGPLPSFERAAAEVSAVVALLDLVRRGSRVVDIGCGSGSMVPDFQRMLGPEGTYVGFDVHAPSIAWCRRAFAADRRFRFEVARIRTPYSAEFTTSPEEFRFPVDDGAADFVLAKSVFTHLREVATRHYLTDVRRVLAPGGAALLTAYLLNNGTEPPAWRPSGLQFPFGTATMRWAIEQRPEAVIAYDAAFFRAAVTDAGLSIRRVVPGSWSGRWVAPNPQDLIVVERG